MLRNSRAVIAEAKSESSTDVINLYFTPAINTTSNLIKNYQKLAHYADEQYNILVREYESLGNLHEELASTKTINLLLLCAIDVYSRKSFVVPLKRKSDAHLGMVVF